MAQNTNEMRKRLESLYNYSDEALQVVDDVLDLIDEGNDSDIISELVWESLDSTFIYFADAWDYMRDSGQTDFSEAVDSGYKTITQIASYYCEQEVYDILNEIGLEW